MNGTLEESLELSIGRAEVLNGRGGEAEDGTHEGGPVPNLLFCQRCYYEWKPRLGWKPQTCPHCRSPYWNRPRELPTRICPFCGARIRSRGGKRCPKCWRFLPERE